MTKKFTIKMCGERASGAQADPTPSVFSPSALAGLTNDTSGEVLALLRLRNKCLNEHWFPSLLHARTEIETWRREYNEERPRKALGGLPPAAYAEQL